MTTQTVNLLDPSLIALELGLRVLTFLWLYVGLRDQAFVTGLAKQIKEIRSLQDQVEKRITGRG